MQCPRCSGLHKNEEHCAVAKCCKGNPNVDPPILPTPEGKECPHTPRCPNCGKLHAALNKFCTLLAPLV
ncbi:hypothetical protein JR316_0010958 [Psilocybe cubensis]|uniref:Uncharacterized protein n=1 Tax=Psilocybe cubensis TaxID=181762 RepID=A0ACB8GNU3_PSICU|nr:hypothetical protein JR316_0010958 [Psilocybe cubensis]KAH9477042.1 hypothetical protein JR316_0010958 [Psilocybe cubensis]